VRALAPVPHGRWADAALLTVPMLPPFLEIFRQPVVWDAHLIWWLHAGYFAQGGAFARGAVGNPALAFSHPDYPPLASAPVALAWQALGGPAFYPAAFVNGAVTLAGIAALVYAVRLVTAAGPALWSWLAAIAAGYSAWSPLWIVPTAGFSDAMCATAFAAGAVLVLFTPAPLAGRVRPLTLLLLCAAAMTKNEGQSMVLALAVVATVRGRRDWRRTGWAWLPVAVAAGWLITARLLGAQTDVLAAGRFADLLRGDPAVLDRAPLVLSTMAGRVARIVPPALAGAALGWVLLRRRRRALGLGGDPWLWAVAALYWAALTLIYVVTPYDLHWHLSTSVDRVMIAVVVLSCASAACWAVVAVSPLGADREAVHPDAGLQ
jgi:hypothetical protein